MKKNNKSQNYPGTLISIEGISGTGKSHFGKMAVEKLRKAGHKVIFISDLMGYDRNDLGSRIMDILKSTNDKFFRIGYPTIEAMLILSVKMYEMEKWILPALKKNNIVIEDRGVDTVAIYSAVLVSKKNREKDILTIYNNIYDNWRYWGVLPELTVYLKGRFNEAIKRAEDRNKEIYKKDEIELLKQVSKIYDLNCIKQKKRIKMLDTSDLKPEEIVNKIVDICLKYIKEKNAKV